ncbi:MAG: peptide deformylase [Bacteroidota bacterium]
MAVRPILLLGNPILRSRCRTVPSSERATMKAVARDLRDTLTEFRTRKGFGRGIAAPQIGRPDRIMYIDFEFTGTLINPRIAHRSRQTFTLWDDCFSFPDLLVRVKRHHTIEVAYTDLDGHRRRVRATGALSELLQHEIDHLDGILAIDRAIDRRHIILRSELDRFTAGKGISM